jgi:hypothetical protein
MGQPLVGAALVVVFAVAVMDRDAIRDGAATAVPIRVTGMICQQTMTEAAPAVAE